MDIVRAFADMDLVNFAYVNDDAVFVESGKPEDTNDLKYGLGLFIFSK